MNGTLRAIVIAVAAAGLTGPAAQGQIRRMEGGRALDANFQVGSGGVNEPAGSRLRIDSQLYVDGQVTGLGNFRGTVGYSPTNQLRLDVPSAGLSDFKRRSMGLSDVLGGAGGGTLRYYSRGTTVLGLEGIRSGLAVPGSNMPAHSVLTPNLARQLYVDALVNYRKITPQSPGQAITVAPPSPLAPLPGAEAAGEKDPAEIGPAAPGLSAAPDQQTRTDPFALPVRPGTGALFGVLRTEDRRSLARELYQVGQAEGQGRALAMRVDAAVRAAVDLTADRPKDPDDPDAGGRGGVPAAGHTLTADRPVTRARAGTDRKTVPKANQDVFLDLLVQLRELREERKAAAKPPAAKPPAAGRDYLAGPAPVEVASLAEDPTTRPAAMPDADADEPLGDIVERLGTEGIILHSLAGRQHDRFNFYMAMAERKLGAGRYEEAALNYEYAIISDSGNPLKRVALARVGLSLTLVVIGEPLRAAVNLRRAMELFPPLMMETRINLGGIMDTSVLERQMIVLDKRLDAAVTRVEPQLAFLAIWVHYNANEMVEANRYARRLLAAAPEDKLYKAYATFVLTGRRPGEAAGKTPPKPGT